MLQYLDRFLLQTKNFYYLEGREGKFVELFHAFRVFKFKKI